MYTDNDLGKLRLNGMMDSEEDNQEKSLRWLLEMDLSEPEEKLFTVAVGEYSDRGLSAYEAEIAGRPLVRGHANSDDLASYIGEEIVISSAYAPGDIYSRRNESAVEESTFVQRDEVMAIDFSRGRDDSTFHKTSVVAEGTDILGLLGDDDIGEKFLSIKRLKPLPVNGQTTQSDEQLLQLDSSGASESGLAADTFDHTVPVSINLTGAPVPTQVADPESDTGANDSGPGDVFDHASVLEYVASTPQPVDDNEFDSYLLRGEHLLDSHFDPEELIVERTEGVIAVDPSTEVSIDYHEDFHTMGGFVQDSVAAIATVITPVMEAISSAVRARLEVLGLAADAVAVEVRLGSDEESSKLCYAEGYEPVCAICFELPQPLLSIDQAARDTIYVRLMNIHTNENWNHLFSEDFVASSKSSLAVDDGFGEDIFGDDFTDDFSAQELFDGSVVAADIEAVFSNLSHPQDDSDEIFGVGFRAFEDRETGQHSTVQSVKRKILWQSKRQLELQPELQEQLRCKCNFRDSGTDQSGCLRRGAHWRSNPGLHQLQFYQPE